MAVARPTSGRLAGASVTLSIAGMLVGGWLLFGTTRPELGWLLFDLSFAGRLAGAPLAHRAGSYRGRSDR